MRARLKWFSALAATLFAAPPAAGQDFDYYLLALSWSPSWCAAEGDTEGQCDPSRDLGFILHGLWPQFEEGWPEFCEAPGRDPSRRETAAMADIMGSGGLAWHAWKKHGRCAGLPTQDYFALARLAYGLVTLPELDGPSGADEVETAFAAANPGLDPEELIVTCRDGRLDEVRICLTRELEPRACAADVADDACRQSRPLAIPPIP